MEEKKGMILYYVQEEKKKITGGFSICVKSNGATFLKPASFPTCVLRSDGFNCFVSIDMLMPMTSICIFFFSSCT